MEETYCGTCRPLKLRWGDEFQKAGATYDNWRPDSLRRVRVEFPKDGRRAFQVVEQGRNEAQATDGIGQLLNLKIKSIDKR